MARQFGLTTGTERGTPGYDVTSPFMSGLKENLSSIVPLALNATALKMDEEKTNALLSMRKQELADKLAETKQKIDIDRAVNVMKQIELGVKTGEEGIIKGLENTGQLKSAIGIEQWPRIMKQDRSSAEDLMQLVPTDRLRMPMSAEDKLIIAQSGAADLARMRDETTRRGQDIGFQKAMAAITGAADRADKRAANGEQDMRLNQEINTTKAHYNDFLKTKTRSMTDDMGFVRPEFRDQYKSLADETQAMHDLDMRRVEKKLKPLWRVEPNEEIRRAAGYLGKALDRNDAMEKIRTLKRSGWSDAQLNKIADYSGWE